jgi:hypothetical protein
MYPVVQDHAIGGAWYVHWQCQNFLTQGHSESPWAYLIHVSEEPKHKRIHTSKHIKCVKIIAKDQLWVPVQMPYPHPHNPTGEWLNASMEAKTIPKPLIMLIDCENIINSSSPKSPPLKAIGLALDDKLWLVYIKVRCHHIPVIQRDTTVSD